MVAKSSTFRQQKFFLFYLKFSAEVNELTLKATASSQKMHKTKIVQKKYIYAFFGPEGLSDRSRLCEEPQNRVLSTYFNSFSLSKAKVFTIKSVLGVRLASLTIRDLERALYFKHFEKNTGNFMVHLDDKNISSFT